MDRTAWLTVLQLTEDEVPQLLVTEGTWWRDRAAHARLSRLEGVRETGMPDLWFGRFAGVPVAWCAAYGAPRAIEPVHVLGTCGTPVVVQIGSCGSLQPHVRTGDVVISSRATTGEGASRHYGAGDVSYPDAELVARAAAAFGEVPVHVGPTVTTDALLRQPDELVAQWAGAGHLGVDMETSAVFSVASTFGMRALSLLYAWDELPARSWTDAFTPAEHAAHRRADTATFEVALQLLDTGWAR